METKKQIANVITTVTFRNHGRSGTMVDMLAKSNKPARISSARPSVHIKD